MSLEIVRGVDRDFPALLQQNVNRTCYAFVVEVIKRLRAAGHQAFHVAKSPGEGQYVPAGFTARTVIGLDGKVYPCSGVSHDALWCDNQQFDTIGRGNDSPDPIGMTGEPVWNAIPQQYWRPNNPPLIENGPQPAPQPQPTPQPQSGILPKGDAFARLKDLDAFYRAPDGLNRPEGIGGDMEAIAQWFYQMVIEGKSWEAVKAQIRGSDEWRLKHPGQTP